MHAVEGQTDGRMDRQISTETPCVYIRGRTIIMKRITRHAPAPWQGVSAALVVTAGGA